MASAEKQDLVPDKAILSAILQIPEDKLTDWNVISNTFTTCTFSTHIETGRAGFPSDLLIRLETSGSSSLAAVAELQALGHAQLPELVPTVLDVGAVTAADGRQVEYSVTPYYVDMATLEEVWEMLDRDHQLEIVDAIVRAVERLQEADHHGKVGGPKLGYFQSVEDFLRRGMPLRDCSFAEAAGNLVLSSAFEEIGQVTFSQSDLAQLNRDTVLCHNDLEPRNILVRSVAGRYELAAIIDWEMAGFYPFAYEHGVKDSVLGSSNLLFGWYSLFKERTAHLLPAEECHTKLIQALAVVYESRKRAMTRNVGVRVQAKWIAREQVTKSADVRRGWVREEGCEAPSTFTKEVKDNLELEVLKELGYA